jgi:hypothetical protein
MHPTESDKSSPAPFIPKSINETIIPDEQADERRVAIEKRRREHDSQKLHVDICFYFDPEEIDYIPEAIKLQHLGTKKLDKQPLRGTLLTFTSPELQLYQTDWVAQLPENSNLTRRLKSKLSLSSKLPLDIPGYVFHAAPVTPRIDDNLGQFNQGDRMIFNGDGMIYRLNFENGQPHLKTRLMKTPCYYADLATQILPEYGKGLWPFLDGGMVRSSLLLGTRSQANTAFVVTKDQLIVTFDGARPTIIDPDSLEILDVVGRSNEWLGLIPNFIIPRPLEQMFEPYSTNAHPVYDHSLPPEHPDINNFYAVNYSQGLTLLNVFSRLRKWLLSSLGRQGRVLTFPFGGFTDIVRYHPEKPLARWRLYLPGNEPVIVEQAAHQMALTEDYILVGDIAFELETAQIFAPFWFGNIRARIRQFRKNHQFFSKLITVPFRLGNWLSSIFFKIVLPLSHADIYLVRRADLQKDQPGLSDRPGFFKLPAPLMAIKITLPREVAHFVVDYQNPDGIITLNATHNVGWDVTEWIGEFDQSIHEKSLRQKLDRWVNHRLFQTIDLFKPLFQGKSTPSTNRIYNFIDRYQNLLITEDLPDRRKNLNKQDLIGMSASPVDLNILARYHIDGQTGAILKSTFLSEPGTKEAEGGRNTWSPSVNTSRNLQRDQATETDSTIKNLYWMSWGHSWEMVPKRIYLAYKNRNVRTIPIEAMDAIDTDKPMTLLRLDTEQMSIVDSFEFPIGYFVRAPQFIPSSDPCPDGLDPSIHGYLCCAVLADDHQNFARDEFWIFHADDLKNKPIYRLSHPDVNLGLMIHSTWLPPEHMKAAKEKYSADQRADMRRHFIESDYQEFAAQHICKQVNRLYQEVIAEYFIPQISENETRKALIQKRDSN